MFGGMKSDGDMEDDYNGCTASWTGSVSSDIRVELPPMFRGDGQRQNGLHVSGEPETPLRTSHRDDRAAMSRKDHTALGNVSQGVE